MFVLRRACCGGKRRQHHSQTAKKSSESGLRHPRSEMAPSGRLLPTAGRARARPHLAACAPGRLEQAAHGEKPPPRCGKSSGPSPGPKPRPSWLWRGSGCERPSSTAGGARQQAVGRCLTPPPGPRTGTPHEALLPAGHPPWWYPPACQVPARRSQPFSRTLLVTASWSQYCHLFSNWTSVCTSGCSKFAPWDKIFGPLPPPGTPPGPPARGGGAHI